MVHRPSVTRNEPWANSTARPMANRTWDGSREVEVQAEPVEQAIPNISKLKRMDSPSIYLIAKFALLGSLLAGWLAKTVGTPLTILTGGVISVAGAILFLRKLPELRQIVRPIYVKMGVIPEVAEGIQNASESDLQ